MAEDLTVGHPSFYRGSGLEGRPLFAPNTVNPQGTPFIAAERPQPMQFGDKLRGYSLYQLPPNYVGVPAAQPQAVPMYLNPNTQPADPMGVFQLLLPVGADWPCVAEYHAARFEYAECV
jgi:hypothetical protein